MMRFVRIISLLLLIQALSCCSRDPLVEGVEEPSLSVTLDIPSAVLTRADEGETPAQGRENDLHDLRLWVFTSSDRALVGYLDIQEGDFPTHGEARRYAIPVSRSFADDRPQVDVFVFANQESVGLSLGESATWQDLNGATFGWDHFGVDNPVREVSEGTGLPMSGVLKNASVEGREPDLTVPTVKLRRCVSKVRFLFSRTNTVNPDNTDIIENVSVDTIVLNGNRFPLNEYVFAPSGSANIAPGGYVEKEIRMAGPSPIASSEAPEKYSYASQDATSYDNLLDAGVAGGELTDGGTLYLRETDRQLTGYIVYSITKQGVKEQKKKSFSMVAPGHFVRNHSWTVFGYFLSGRNLQLSMHVDDWNKSKYSVDFSEQSITVTEKFTISEQSAELESVGGNAVDVYLLPGTPARGSLKITNPVGGKLFIRPEGDVSAFEVTPTVATINPEVNNGNIDISVKRNPNAVGSVTGKSIKLSFTVENGGRESSADSEIIDKDYLFIL